MRRARKDYEDKAMSSGEPQQPPQPRERRPRAPGEPVPSGPPVDVRPSEREAVEQARSGKPRPSEAEAAEERAKMLEEAEEEAEEARDAP